MSARVLVVDDEPLLRAAVAMSLGDQGFIVDEAPDGEAGWERFVAVAPDVSLVDLRMPRLHGLGLVERIVRHDPDAAVVVISAAGEAADVIAALRAGAWDYLVKPVVDMGMLLHAVERALERRRLIRQNREYQAELEASLRQLRCAQEEAIAAAKMAAVGDLVAGVAHAVNTPLGVGLTAASLMAERSRTLATDLRRGCLSRSELDRGLNLLSEAGATLVASLRHAASVVESLGKLAADQQREDPVDLELGAYLAQMALSLAPQVESAGHHLEVRCAAPLWVRVPPGAIMQILLQLVRNSLDHGLCGLPSGQSITIAADFAPSGRVVLRCCDSGRGLAAEILPRIFDPFFSTTPGARHSGLGLAIAHALATHALGGRLWVEAVPQGACFVLEFPSRR
ncbi:hypothetical protein TDMWS_04450 [Thermodesulfomicrobium sp. WS]|uniref:sensor histidine kinase n=1 Tax=Thermodesulfomicrobium sp. WS TaxID=3004129 RepID=UPI002490E897|nr:hybrid sensor histidine kinase/response regulator [Thermodesulfomicrobium sp. WS]BDV00360.1 hypothetical protein TDMWS_04450 [Thermodesulfomicrobium sp. WS]